MFRHNFAWSVTQEKVYISAAFRRGRTCVTAWSNGFVGLARPFSGVLGGEHRDWVHWGIESVFYQRPGLGAVVATKNTPDGKYHPKFDVGVFLENVLRLPSLPFFCTRGVISKSPLGDDFVRASTEFPSE